MPPAPTAAGIDSVQLSYALAAKLNILQEDPASAAAALAHMVATVRAFRLDLPSEPDNGGVGTAVVGFSARFFRGILDAASNRRLKRWRLPAVPRCLKTMQARGDRCFGPVATLAALAECESDLLLLVESRTERELAQFEKLLHSLNSVGLKITGMTRASVLAAGRDLLGYHHGTSNLQDVRDLDPVRYHGYIYIGNAEPAYAGDTYLVYRKYRVNLLHWHVLHEHEKNRTIGRAMKTGHVIDNNTDDELEPTYDSAEARMAPDCSHIRHVNPRGYARTQFGDVVHPRDVRILRRSFSFESTDRQVMDGLLYLAFQGNIQQRGFEFINNEWIMARGFLGGEDALLAPEKGVVEVLDGCYYWVPVATSLGDVVRALKNAG